MAVVAIIMMVVMSLMVMNMVEEIVRTGELEFWDGEGALRIEVWGEVGEKE